MKKGIVLEVKRANGKFECVGSLLVENMGISSAMRHYAIVEKKDEEYMDTISWLGDANPRVNKYGIAVFETLKNTWLVVSEISGDTDAPSIHSKFVLRKFERSEHARDCIDRETEQEPILETSITHLTASEAIEQLMDLFDVTEENEKFVKLVNTIEQVAKFYQQQGVDEFAKSVSSKSGTVFGVADIVQRYGLGTVNIATKIFCKETQKFGRIIGAGEGKFWVKCEDEKPFLKHPIHQITYYQGDYKIHDFDNA